MVCTYSFYRNWVAVIKLWSPLEWTAFLFQWPAFRGICYLCGKLQRLENSEHVYTSYQLNGTVDVSSWNRRILGFNSNIAQWVLTLQLLPQLVPPDPTPFATITTMCALLRSPGCPYIGLGGTQIVFRVYSSSFSILVDVSFGVSTDFRFPFLWMAGFAVITWCANTPHVRPFWVFL